MRTRITHISFRALIPLLLFFTLVINAPGLSAAPAGSTYPVQVSPMLIPPYSLYLSDYFSGTTERLSLTLTNRDLQQPQVRVKLRLTIACASGLTLTTHPQAIFDPIVLDAGVPTRLTMQELAPYFLPARLLTQGYMQGGKLSEGNVEFGFEVLEYNTGKVLSQKNIAFGNIISPKPPKLNLPINNDIVTVNEPQQLTFQWSPQYFSTGNVEYEFVIKELMDKTASPQEAFLYSREVYRTTTTASAINYTMGEPTLEGNKRYAWCVRAVMHDGVETVNRFENDGYSPVSVFDMRYNCRPPIDVQATTERGTIMLRWLPQPHHLKYVVSYRRTDFDANTWYTKTPTSTLINLSDITPGQNYTYRVGAYCDDNTPVYSAPGTISVPAEDTEFLANCGKDPQIKITNRKPKGQLNVNDIIMAGDFPVTLTSVSGSNGTFTGEGSVRIPYLFANFAVRFNNINVSEENRLIGGVIETKYDKTENGIANLDALDQGGTDGNIKSGITKANKTVEFALPEKFTVQYSEELATLTFKDETGTAIGNVDIPKNPAGKPILPLTVEDKNGNVYEVHENPEKSISSTQPYVAVKLGKQEGEDGAEAEKLDEEDKSISANTIKDLIYVTIEGRNDTIFNAHTIYLPRQNTNIKLKVGFKEGAFRNKSFNTFDATTMKSLKYNSIHWKDSINMNLTTWSHLAGKIIDKEYLLNTNMAGSSTLKLDASRALNAIFRYTDPVTGLSKDTLGRGNLIKETKIEINLNIADGGLLNFKPKNDDYYKDYGFDDALVPQLQQANDYGTPLNISGTNYYAPWLYLLPNTEAEIKLEYHSSNPQMDSLIVLEGNNQRISFSKTNSNIVTINTNASQIINLSTLQTGNYRIDAYSLIKGNIKTLIGKLNVESRNYSNIVKKIRIIRVKRKDENVYFPFSSAKKIELIQNINAHYKQAFVTFELDGENYQDTLTINKTKQEAIDSIETQVYNKLPNIAKKSDRYYIFVCTPGPNASIQGSGAFLGRYSIIYNQTSSSASHEIGHNFGLLHTFLSPNDNVNENKPDACKRNNRILNKSSTKDIMDYNDEDLDPRHYFFLYQINHLKNK